VLRKTYGGALLALLALAAVAVPQAAQAAKKPKPQLTVMSRNLYLGADIIQLVTAPDVATEEQKVAALHQTVNQTNFALRAKAIASEIRKTKPDIVGLQEVARYYKGADGVHDGIKDATTPVYDWLALLRKQIKARHLHYRVVSQETEIDVEVPSAEGYDLRLKLGNAVLLRTGKGAHVKLRKPLKGVFSDQLTVPLADQTVKLSRGYAGMTGTVAGKRFIFLDPHAEAYSDADATKQFKQLVRTAAKSRRIPTIIAGDFNSDPAASGGGAGGYNAVIRAGFKDTGKRANTCCQDENLLNPQSKLNQWIDHIVVRPAAKVIRSVIVGNRVSDKIGGLWPSDHAGVVATIRLK
jgi:endonuclease/exonuclease/phosphatase family metal-dependent hydrolase